MKRNKAKLILKDLREDLPKMKLTFRDNYEGALDYALALIAEVDSVIKEPEPQSQDEWDSGYRDAMRDIKARLKGVQ